MGFMNCALESWAIHVCVTIVFVFEKKIGIRHHNHRGPCLKYNVLLGVNYESDILVFSLQSRAPKIIPLFSAASALDCLGSEGGA
jgi:hypothetical protein